MFNEHPQVIQHLSFRMKNFFGSLFGFQGADGNHFPSLEGSLAELPSAVKSFEEDILT